MRRERGQAAVEFFFVMLGVLLILGFMVVLFSFAQGVYLENTRARADVLKSFHDDKQYKTYDKVYPPAEIKVEVRSVPFLERLISGAPAFTRSLSLRGGTKPPIFGAWGAAEECIAASALVQQLTPVKTGMIPRWQGDEIGALAALGICEAYHMDEF